MILIATKHVSLRDKLATLFRGKDLKIIIYQPRDPTLIEKIYSEQTSAIIIDHHWERFPQEAAIDILNCVGKQKPTIVLAPPSKNMPNDINPPEPWQRLVAEKLTVLQPDQFQDIIRVIEEQGRLEGLQKRRMFIPIYESQSIIQMIRKDNGIGIIAITVPDLSKIGIEYGIEVSYQAKYILHHLLLSMWGRKGCFRESDFICQKKKNSNTYFIFIHPSRKKGKIPKSGYLEKIANRISHNIQRDIWNKFFFRSPPECFPHTLKSVPIAGVGSYTLLHNPCIDIYESLEEAIISSTKIAQGNIIKISDHQREFIQAIVKSEDLLFPHFQGVFSLRSLTSDLLKEAKDQNSILPLKHLIFGFESLIRINKAALEKGPPLFIGLDTDQMRPDALFTMAKSVNLSLELDQTCLKKAIQYQEKILGKLMINILPRNLCYIDRIISDWGQSPNIVFEVSESEAINNFELLAQSQKLLESLHMEIAADDFGTGFASINRVIKTRPQIIKFDRSIIQNIHADPIKKAYVKGLVNTSSQINTLLLAEGVELWEEAACLQEMGVDLVQGFLTHKPQDIDTLTIDLQSDKQVA